VNSDGVVTLIFTIDTSGSMEPVIDQAKAIAKALTEHGRESKVNYILATFGKRKI